MSWLSAYEKLNCIGPKQQQKEGKRTILTGAWTEAGQIRALLWFLFWKILVKALLKEQNEPHNGDIILWYFYSCIRSCFKPILFSLYFHFRVKSSNYPSLALTATLKKNINASPKWFIVTENTWSNFPSIRGIIWPSTITNSVKISLPVAKKPGD